MKIIFFKFCFFIILFLSPVYLNADILKKVEISGNKRIIKDTIMVYGEIQKGKDYSPEEINTIIKKLYETKFFSKIAVDFANGILNITVEENPIVNSIIIQGEPADKFKKVILDALTLKEKSSYIKSDVKNDIEIIKDFYRAIGYYSPKVEARTQEALVGKNLLNLIFVVDKGERQKISKI